MPPHGLLIDIDGVLTVSWEPLRGSREALVRLREAGVPMAFVTNTTSMTRQSIAETLAGSGLPVDPDQVVTAPSMAGGLIRRHYPDARCWLVGSRDVASDLGDVDLVDATQPPDVVLLGGAGPEFDYPTLNRVFRLALEGLPVVAMHRNLYWETKTGLQLDTGAFLSGIERAAGIEATVVGKPAPACFAAALEVVDLAEGEVMMVGDDLEADIAGAQGFGIRAALVRTGKYRSEVLAASSVVPDLVVDSFADVPALVGL
jgi:HAD superfamily hydrolase (TIGR01458 family)